MKTVMTFLFLALFSNHGVETCCMSFVVSLRPYDY